MKNKKIKISFAFVLALWLLSSCDKWVDVNTNPNLPEKISQPSLLLPAALTNTAYTTGSTQTIITSLLSQQFAANGSAGNEQTRYFENYQISDNDVDDIWFTSYVTCLKKWQDIINTQTTHPNYTGIAKVMKAYVFSLVVDSWGNVPFSEALLGASNPVPKYDNSKDIYDALFVLLDDAIVDLNAADLTPPGADDFVYGGNLTTWIRAANSLKLRLALNYANVDNGAKLVALVNSGAEFMSITTDNLEMKFQTVTENPNRQNPLYGFSYNRIDYVMAGKTLVDMMNAKTDPRRASYFTEYFYGSGNYKGSGYEFDTPHSSFSRMHTYLLGAAEISPDVSVGDSLGFDSYTYDGSAPARMLTAAEVRFILAEAVLRYGANGDAFALYKEGIEVSMVDVGIDQTDIDTYLANEDLDQTLTESRLLNEKYVATYGVPCQGWTDYRRTSTTNTDFSGLPALTTPSTAVGLFPRIFFYTQSEKQVNAGNVPSRTTMSAKGVFWDN